jgi:hypothetical protein
LFPGAIDFLERIASPEAAGIVGTVGMVIAFVWGQIATRKTASKLADAGADPANKNVLLK